VRECARVKRGIKSVRAEPRRHSLASATKSVSRGPRALFLSPPPDTHRARTRAGRFNWTRERAGVAPRDNYALLGLVG